MSFIFLTINVHINVFNKLKFQSTLHDPLPTAVLYMWSFLDAKIFQSLFQCCSSYVYSVVQSFHIEAHLFWHRDFDGLSRLFCWGTRYGCSHGSTMSIVQSRFNLLLTSIAFFPKNFTSKSFTLILISRPRNSYQTTLHSLWTRKWNVCSKSRYLEFNQIVSADASCLVSHQQNI